MKIALVAAMAANRVIGKDMQMPWHLPAELQYFKKITLGKPIVMGRATFEAIGRPLPGRTNIILTRQEVAASAQHPSVVWVHSADQAIAAAGDASELMVIGGGKIYELFLPLADRLYLTKIDLDVAGDTYFPNYTAAGHWNQVSEQRHESDANNPHAFTTLIYDRVR
ncbi:MAG: type 3 dihydrofolate reductase [Idiomarina sp.]